LRHSIEELRLDTEKQIHGLRADTQRDIADCKTELVKWMTGMMVAQGGIVVALIKLL